MDKKQLAIDFLMKFLAVFLGVFLALSLFMFLNHPRKMYRSGNFPPPCYHGQMQKMAPCVNHHHYYHRFDKKKMKEMMSDTSED